MALVTLLGFLPTLLLSVPAGVLADMFDRRALMMIGDGCSAIGVLYILLCMNSGGAALWQICLGVFISASFSALLEPAFKATITDLLTQEEYTKANGLTSLSSSARYLVSPMIAGSYSSSISAPSLSRWRQQRWYAGVLRQKEPVIGKALQRICRRAGERSISGRGSFS